MKSKEEFDNAYKMLCEKLYLPGGVFYKEIVGIDREAEEIRDELFDVKRQIDKKLRYYNKLIYETLKIK